MPLSLSCARLPPSVSGFTGRRIRVTMTFNGTMQSAFYYYFLINRYGPTGTLNANGPVPVLGTLTGQTGSLGNGYATGSNGNSAGTISDLPDYGITDFVLFHSPQQNNIGLYHYTADPNTQPTPPNYSRPFNVVLPSSSSVDIDPNAAKTLQFDLYISQLVTDTTDTDGPEPGSAKHSIPTGQHRFHECHADNGKRKRFQGSGRFRRHAASEQPAVFDD